MQRRSDSNSGHEGATDAKNVAEQQMQAVLDSATEVSIIATDCSGVITLFNRGAEKMLGYSADEMVGKRTPLSFHLESEVETRGAELGRELGRPVAGIEVFVENALRIGAEQHEWTYRRKDGSHIPVSLTITVIRDKEGVASGYLGIAEDITRRRAMERQCRESEELLGTIINSLPCPLFYKDADGMYLDCNTAFCNYLGLPREKIIGSTVYDVAPAELAELYHRADLELMMRQGTQIYEAEVRYADGTPHDVTFYKSTILRPNGTVRGLVGIMLDITERKRAEQERERLAQHLLQAQKIDSIGRLAGGVAHDFNNLLTPIMGYAEMLRKSCNADERSFQRINAILDAATKARNLTRQLLAFGRKQILEMKIIDLNQVIESFSPILERTIRANVDITMKLDPALGAIQADRTQLEQIIMNLAINAQDAMPNGGALLIETANVDLGVSPAASRDLQPGSYVILTASDTGCGMTPEIQNQIFEPFFTTKELGSGTGLGLSTVFGIVKQHGGHILVYSESGRGTTFKLYFPRLEERPLRDESGETNEIWAQRHDATILLVEDNPIVREMTRDLLEEYGYHMLVAEEPGQAAALLRDHGGTVDLLLSDVIMPGMDGPTLHEVLKAMQPDLKVLYMSGYTENIIMLQGILDESPNYIQKPFTAQALLRKVDEIIVQKQAQPEPKTG